MKNRNVGASMLSFFRANVEGVDFSDRKRCSSLRKAKKTPGILDAPNNSPIVGLGFAGNFYAALLGGAFRSFEVFVTSTSDIGG